VKLATYIRLVPKLKLNGAVLSPSPISLISWYLIRYRGYLTLIDAVRQCGVFWYFSLCVQGNGIYIYKVVAKFWPSRRGNVEVVKSRQ
jgi:hypothetical protein